MNVNIWLYIDPSGQIKKTPVKNKVLLSKINALNKSELLLRGPEQIK